MPEPLVYLLLFVALVLPVLGVLALRLLEPRLGQRGIMLGAAGLFVLAILSTVILARSEVQVLRIGGYSLLLPGAQRSDMASLPPPATPIPPPPLPPTLTPRPTATPTPTATPEPTAAPEPPTESPAAGRRYVVQAGDTLRAIAERFGVSVSDLLRANNLTPEQADSLRAGQELIIP